MESGLNRTERLNRLKKLKRLNRRKKNFLVLSIVMLYLFGNTVIYKSNTAVENNKRPTSDTFTSLGGSYSIDYILKNYGVFSFKDITGSHVVGSLVAKEKVYKTAENGLSIEPINQSLIVSDLSNNISSYVGIVKKLKGESIPPFKMNHIYNADKSVPTLYTRYSDLNIWQDGKPYKLYYDNKTESFLNPNNGNDVPGTGNILQNDNFIDFDEAKKVIKQESLNLLSRPGKVVSPEPDTGYLRIEAGSNYIINDASNLRLVDFIFPEGYDGLNIYPYPTFINFTGENLAKSGTKFKGKELPAGNLGNITLPTFADESHQFFPDVYVNGVQFIGTKAGPSGSPDYGENMNILWNLPNVKTLNGGYKVSKIGNGDIIGHIVAPDAQFFNYGVDGDGVKKWIGGNINGAAIVDSWYGGKREVHYWPYMDDLDNPIFKDFYIKASKSLTGKDLIDGEFKFILNLTNSSVEDGIKNANFPMESTNRVDGTINFPLIEFTKAGTYEFSIKEVIGSEPKTTYDKSEYKLIAEVTKNTMLNSFDVISTIYKVVDSNGVSLENNPEKVTEIEFNNEYDYKLPSTGGTGINGLLILGMTMMLSSLGTLVWKKL